jgi:hypothetical protein
MTLRLSVDGLELENRTQSVMAGAGWDLNPGRAGKASSLYTRIFARGILAGDRLALEGKTARARSSRIGRAGRDPRGRRVFMRTGSRPEGCEKARALYNPKW